MGVFSKKSLLLNGTTEYASGGNVLDKLRTDAFTLVGWFKTTVVTGTWLASKLEDPTFRGYGVSISSVAGEVRWGLFNTGALKDEIGTNAATFNDGAWHHIAAVSSGTGPAGMFVYIDGSLEATTVLTSTLASNVITNTGPFNLGSRSDGVQPFAGNLDDWAVYNKGLSGAEITTIYNEGDAPDLNAVGPIANVQALFEFDGDTLPTVLDQSAANDLTVTGGSLVFDTAGPHDQVELPVPTLTVQAGDAHGQVEVSTGGGGGGGPVETFVMRGRDDARVPGSDYIVWVVTVTPDFAGAGFAGGDPTPIGSLIAGSVVVASQS